MQSHLLYDLHIPALIPEDFIPDVHMRLIMYKRIASTKLSSELNELKEEIIDRFGLLPDAVKNLFEVSNLKQLARPLGIRKIDVGLKGGRIFFQPDANIDSVRIIQLIQTAPNIYKLDGQDTLRINKELPDAQSRLETLKYVFNEITLNIAA